MAARPLTADDLHTIDAPTGLTSREHIYVDDASDYYELGDGLPQFPGDHEDLWEEEHA